LPSILATTRRRISEKRELVMNIVRGVVETIHLFKTRPDIAAPLLQRFMNFNEPRAAEALHAFYVPLFPAIPRPDLSGGLQTLRDLFAKRYPAAANLQESDFVDASIIDEVERSGYVEKLYGGSPR
jgi:ABC-type nitrate/sulfonate/bicarbonate transport system substrate-binding protein